MKMRFIKHFKKSFLSVAELIAASVMFVILIASGFGVAWLFIFLLGALGDSFFGIVKAIMLEGLAITFYVVIFRALIDTLEEVERDGRDKANGYDYTDHIY